MRAFLGSVAVCLSACAAPATLPEVAPEIAADAWRFSDHAAEIKRASCNPFARLPEADITIAATPIGLGGTLEGLTYVGGWHLTSEVPTFGGLSGVDVMPDGDLLTVSDQGVFFRIGMTDGVPDGSGTLSLMRGADGKILDGKTATDAEGLVYEQGLALVSFEREHRILGFAFELCAGGARGVDIASLPGEQAGKMFDPNKGAEALSLSPDGELTFGYETGPGNGMPLGMVYGNGDARLNRDAGGPGGFAQVGRDELGETVAELFRSYDPIRGNRNVIRIGEMSARMTKPMTVDNFEGIALQELPSGGLRIWIISDDNFNPKQRTLLMAFDLQGR